MLHMYKTFRQIVDTTNLAERGRGKKGEKKGYTPLKCEYCLFFPSGKGREDKEKDHSYYVISLFINQFIAEKNKLRLQYESQV